MSRKKLSEYRAKTLLYAALDQTYEGIGIDVTEAGWKQSLKALPKDTPYVVKVDQAIKGRFKKGLVKLDRSAAQLPQDISELAKQGFDHFLVEPYRPHTAKNEAYFALARTREGVVVSYTTSGGVDVESHQATIKHLRYKPGLSLPKLAMSAAILAQLQQVFEDNYFSFLEINPLLIQDGAVSILDAAVEVDDEADFFVKGRWTADDLRSYSSRQLTPEEDQAHELNEQSQASFSLEVINPNGSIFVLLSGGGASVVVADEVNNLGLGHELANYGEYSGNPNAEETYAYTRQVLSLLRKSTAKRKVLIIGGGVANFTDVRATFVGVVQALKEIESDLRAQQVKVFVRRGGPHEAEGLAAMRQYLDQAGLLGHVGGPELVLTDVVRLATEGVTV